MLSQYHFFFLKDSVSSSYGAGVLMCTDYKGEISQQISIISTLTECVKQLLTT
jgi:hypothetical protein